MILVRMEITMIHPIVKEIFALRERVPKTERLGVAVRTKRNIPSYAVQINSKCEQNVASISFIWYTRPIGENANEQPYKIRFYPY